MGTRHRKTDRVTLGTRQIKMTRVTWCTRKRKIDPGSIGHKTKKERNG